MCLLIYHVLTIRKVSLDLSRAGAWAGHPWVCKHFFESGSIGGIEGHHLFEKILELGSVDVIACFSFGMSLPESCRLSGSDKTIVRVTGVSTGERRSLSDDHEKDDSGGKKVNAGTLIWPAQLDLRSHVRLSSKLSLEHARRITALNRSSKTKIGDLKRVIFVEKKIFWFEVTMGDSLTVHETQAIKQLLEVVAGGSFTEAAAEGNEVEELTTSYKLKADELDILSSLLRVRLLTFADFDEAHDIVVLKLGESSDFCLD